MDLDLMQEKMYKKLLPQPMAAIISTITSWDSLILANTTDQDDT